MSSKKNKILIVGIICFLLIILGVVIVVVNNKNEKNISDNNFNQETVSKEEIEKVDEETLIVLSINPKIMLKVKDNTIIEIYQLNDDSIIFTNEKLKGLELEKGIETIINISKENNYIKDDTMVKVSLYNKSKESQNVINVVESKFNEININIESYDINDDEKNEIKNIVSDYKEQIKTYTVTFNSNGGSNVNSQTIKENQIVSKPNNPIRNGYTFLGWYYNNNKFDFNTKINQDMTIVAQWKEILTEKNIVVEEPISYSTKEENEVNLKRGTRIVTQNGKNGKKNITYKVVYNSQNKEVSRTKISEDITENPTNEIVKVGISDYNLNSDKITGWTHGYACKDTTFFEQDGEKYQICTTHVDEYNSIIINNKEYLTSFNSNQIRPLIYLRLENDREMPSTTINGTKYYFEAGYGEIGTNNPLTEQDCTKYGLACGRW